MLKRLICLTPLTLFLLCASVAHSAEIYRWVDEKGKVHFGDKPNVPAGDAQRVQTQGGSPSEVQRREAELRAERERREALRDERRPVQAGTAIGAGTKSAKEKCEEEWRRYNEAQACIGRVGRNANGSLRSGGEACQEVKQPERCD